MTCDLNSEPLLLLLLLLLLVAFTLHARIGGGGFDESLPVCALIFFLLKWRSAGVHRFQFLGGQIQSTVAQRAEMTVNDELDFYL